MQLPDFFKTATLVVVLLACVAPIAIAQDVYVSDDMAKKMADSKKHEKNVPLFPNATRSEPGQGISTTDMNDQITKLLALVNTGKNSDEAIAMGQKLAANHDATHYDRAIADQAIGYAYLTKGDKTNGIAYLQKAIELNALSNNEHYTVMLQVAKTQIAAGQADAGLATLDRVIAETRQDKPEYNGIRGRVAFAKKDYAAAAAALEKSIGGSAQPDPNEQQMLLMSYVELKQPERAEKIAESIARAHPEDKVATMNLVAIYQQSGKSDKAVAQLEDARKRGMLTDANDYRRLYALYSNIKGREKDSAAVINEGLQKGILQPGNEVYLVLGDDYYFTGQIPQAIDAYRKADAVSTDGEAALKLAKVYNNQGQAAEAKAAAERALQKGVKQPADAHGIIDRAATVTKKPVKKK